MIEVEDPASTIALAACACEVISASAVQPGGAVAATPNVRSSGVSLRSVSVKLKLASVDPWSSGKSVVSVTSPAAFGVTRMSTGSDAVEPSLERLEV